MASSWRESKLRMRLITFFLMTTLITLVTSVFSFYSAQSFIDGTDDLFSKSIELNYVHDNLSLAEKHLEAYLSTKSSESLTAFNRLRSSLQAWSERVQAQTFYIGQDLTSLNISRMLETFATYSSQAIEAKRGRSIDLYVELFNKSHKIAGFIYEAIDRQAVEQLRLSTEQYQTMSSRINAMQVFNVTLVVVVILVNIAMIILFSKRFTEPITQLVKTSAEVAQGNFDVEQPHVDTHDEIASLSDAFYTMVRELKTYFSEITEKAELEVSLKEERMRNLHMESELREAEFKALQAQMNPHFIYNTINIGAQIAMLEGDEKTCVFLENVAEVFRYNLRSMASPVTLSDEIGNIQAYMFVLKMRFAELVEYVERVEQDEDMLKTPMPRLTLQPIVENAYRHGLSEMEHGGRIVFSARREGDRAIISVSDNGAGMTYEQVEDALAGKSGTTGSTATGLGIGNIIQRLRLFFEEDVFSIESEKGKGTCVTLRLPIRGA